MGNASFVFIFVAVVVLKMFPSVVLKTVFQTHRTYFKFLLLDIVLSIDDYLNFI